MKKILIAVTMALVVSACSKHDPLHDSMESMGEAFKAMRKTDDLVTIKQQWLDFKKSANIAKVQQVKPEDQPAFDEGMNKLSDAITQIDRALEDNNLIAAKAAMKQLGEVRKKYHDKLGID